MTTYQITDELWCKIEPLLPPEPQKVKKGRPKMDDRKVMEAIFYLLRNNCRWNELPPNIGVTDTVYRRFREWRNSGVFQRLWYAGILEYDELSSLVRYGMKQHHKNRE